jgi:hypothetical protein
MFRFLARLVPQAPSERPRGTLRKSGNVRNRLEF